MLEDLRRAITILEQGHPLVISRYQALGWLDIKLAPEEDVFMIEPMFSPVQEIIKKLREKEGELQETENKVSTEN